MPSELVIELAVYFKLHPKDLYKKIEEYQKELKEAK